MTNVQGALVRQTLGEEAMDCRPPTKLLLHSQGCSVETATAIQTSLGHTFGALNMYLILCYEDVTCKYQIEQI